MKELKIFIIVILCNILMLLVFSCGDDDVSNPDCTSIFIEHFDADPLTNQEIGCNFFVNEVSYEGANYAYLNNHCADFAFWTIIDCQGDTICTTQETRCHNIFWNGEDLGIIGLIE